MMDQPMRPVYGGLNDAVDDCMRKDDEIRQLKAKLAQSNKKVTRLRQAMRDVWNSLPGQHLSPAEYHGIKDSISRVLRETGGRR